MMLQIKSINSKSETKPVHKFIKITKKKSKKLIFKNSSISLVFSSIHNTKNHNKCRSLEKDSDRKKFKQYKIKKTK